MEPLIAEEEQERTPEMKQQADLVSLGKLIATFFG